jgi:thiosulfate/3-mercaptopyruvate sulfurtransferase
MVSIEKMTYSNPESLVSTMWLDEHLSSPSVRIIDATSYMPSQDKDGFEQYNKQHIPGAIYFDINDIADDSTTLPHMLPSPEKFSLKARKLGLSDGDKIVVYDANGGYLAAARVWWMFRLYGHSDVCLLDGGLPKWLAEDRTIEVITSTQTSRHFTTRMNKSFVRSVEQMIANVDTKNEQVIDARSVGRFKGDEPEPRPSAKVGHIPGSLNLPFNTILNPNNHFTYCSAEVIKATISNAGIDLSKPITASCGSGVTACVLAFGLFLIGYETAAVYDGSWSEWGNHPDTPVEQG